MTSVTFACWLVVVAILATVICLLFIYFVGVAQSDIAHFRKAYEFEKERANNLQKCLTSIYANAQASLLADEEDSEDV